jgi:hypothetical protein
MGGARVGKGCGGVLATSVTTGSGGGGTGVGVSSGMGSGEATEVAGEVASRTVGVSGTGFGGKAAPSEPHARRTDAKRPASKCRCRNLHPALTRRGPATAGPPHCTT